ncbi:hypothetical protein ScalyP_jg911 [Parmales sp. scaly parma]|nr:hypothetical protein ScalyP_jg911 [Parmales sp. scaly parma]|tara:strand:+ start:97 stop:555 length:459 start_codon:yes stop_codon:yes gene_type:complete
MQSSNETKDGDEVAAEEMITMSCTSFFFENVSPKLDEFQEEHGHKFKDIVVDDAFDEEKSEQSVEHYDLFMKFGLVFEGLIDKFVEEERVAMGVFRNILTRAARDTRNGVDSMASMLLDLLDSISDFKSFLHFMNTNNLPKIDDNDQDETFK